MSNSLGRPVRMSGVELRLLPRPGFVITDLTVEEDPSYGAEPVLHASYGEGGDTSASRYGADGLKSAGSASMKQA